MTKKLVFLGLLLALCWPISHQLLSHEKETVLYAKISSQSSGDVNTSKIISILTKRLDDAFKSKSKVGYDADAKLFKIEIQNTEDVERAKQLVTSKGCLRFTKTYHTTDVISGLTQTSKFLKMETNLLDTSHSLFSYLPPPTDIGGHLVRAPILGWVIPKNTPLIDKIFSLKEVKNFFPNDFDVVWGKPKEGSDALPLIAIRNSESNIDCSPSLFQKLTVTWSYTEKPQVSGKFQKAYEKKWETLTAESINQVVAIVLDDTAISYPTVMGQITGGAFAIYGFETEADASTILAILANGQLDVQLEVTER